jgi:hypothetical protein
MLGVAAALFQDLSPVRPLLNLKPPDPPAAGAFEKDELAFELFLEPAHLGAVGVTATVRPAGARYGLLSAPSTHLHDEKLSYAH